MIVCPNCQRENEDEYKYCLGCGTVLPRDEKPVDEKPSVQECSNCGAEVPANFKFCGECGTPMKTAAPKPAKEAPAAAEAKPDPKPKTDEKTSTSPGGPPSTHVGAPGSEESPRIGDLVVIKPDGSEGARIPITEGEVALGRDSQYEVLSSDPFLSPHHASLISDGSGHILRDAGSLNGVFIRITTEIELQDGDYVRLGQELLQFNLLESVESVIPTADDETRTGGSPEGDYWGRLSLISGPDVESRGFLFDEDEVVVGREVGDILFRDDGFVSGRHARFTRDDGKTYLKDLGSSNGTYVRIQGQRHVGNGDLILMGQQLFRVEV